jgi:glutamate formiminotransferase/formiminotetrahydrofolate cyclodeaminase
MKLVECVPNFSEGQDKKTLDAIATAIQSVTGVKLLDIDPGLATNRTVFTFAGPPDEVSEAAFLAIKKASELIDMRHHKGAHPRMGATDVCPFIPISGVTMDLCVDLAKRLGKRVGAELKIPVYLYEYAASSSARKSLADIRAGEYEGLAEKIKKPEWKPDFGPQEFNAKSGATVIGARQFLIAYNVNLNTTDVKIAKEIALAIREKGRIKKDSKGNKIVDDHGNTIYEPGLFKHCRATGWLIPEYNCAQVTINLTDFTATPMHEVFDACCKEAEKHGVRVTGSEIVGLVPKQAMIDAGLHYLRKQKMTCGVPEKMLIQTAIRSLELCDVAPFDPSKKIIEAHFEYPTPLASMSLTAFVDELSSNSPAPGGGSIAALAGAVSSGLASMVAALTHNKKGYEKAWEEMERIGIVAQSNMRSQLNAIDKDTEAFNQLMSCFGMPKTTEEEKKARAYSIEEATKEATLVPLGVLEQTITALDLALATAERGNQNSLSDAGVAGLMGYAAALGAYYNVLINLAGISDKGWVDKTRKTADNLVEKARQLSMTIEKIVLEKLKK